MKLFKLSLSDLPWLVAIVFGYAILAKVALYFFSVDGIVSIVWPSSGLALAALLIGGIRFVPAVFVGALITNLSEGISFDVATVIALGNTMEAMAGVWLLRRNDQFDTYFGTLRDYLRLVFMAGFLACSIAAFVGSATLLIAGLASSGDYLQNLFHWWMGDVLGVVLIAPLILTWRRVPADWHDSKRMVEFILLVALFFLVNQVIFLGWFHTPDGMLEQIFRGYWIYLLIVVIAIRFQSPGVSLLLVMTTIQALAGALHGVGFFANDLAQTQLISLWFYIMTLSLVGMALAGFYAERKQATWLLAESEEKYRLLIAAMAEGVVLQDENSSILAFNKSSERILGLSADQLTGRTSLDPRWYAIHENGSPFPGEIHPAVMTLKTGLPQNDVIMGIHKPNGDLTWISVNVQPIFKEGRTTPYRVVATMHDITERKQKEKEAEILREQLAQASKMESIGHLTAGIAHDFNNMLGVMMGYAELSKDMLAAGKPDATVHYHKEILKAGTRAKELIANMLAFGRTAPVKTDEQTPVTLLSPIVKEVVTMLRSAIPTTVNINYRVEVEDLKALITPVHLHQIVLNLGVNARDAMGEYGSIDISLSRYHGDNQLCSACKKRFTGDYAMITVKDSGSGIPDSILNKIFDPFFTTKDVGKGTGMGLSVVHGLVLAARGHILVESSATNGTAFHILLPVVNEASRLQPAIEVYAVNIKGTRIMVVDDELSLATMLQDYLTTFGAQVVSYSDPAKALEAFAQNADAIDLVITDETMPGMSGRLLAEKLMIVRPGLPIIMCTGYSEHTNPDIVKKIGIAGFFQKPLNMNELLQKIQTLCAARIKSNNYT